MYQNLLVDDSCLKGKSIIGVEDVKNLLPENIKEHVCDIRVRADYEGIKWVIYLYNDLGGFLYTPFSREMLYHSYVRKIEYNYIYL